MESIIKLLPKEFDRDLDSVDQMATFEFYLEKSGSLDAISTIPGKPDEDKAILSERSPTRKKIKKITDPILNERIIPLVNQVYGEECQGHCVPCFSLVRRYNDEERRTHASHFDVQAFVTVVVSLASYGVDFEGGIYVTTGASKLWLCLLLLHVISCR